MPTPSESVVLALPGGAEVAAGGPTTGALHRPRLQAAVPVLDVGHRRPLDRNAEVAEQVGAGRDVGEAEVVAAVRGGLLSLEEACQRYTLTTEEFLSWQFSIDQHGLAGLRTTRIQHYRH